MGMELVHLPEVCLEEIFKNLCFADVSRMARTCRYFREVAKTIFRVYFRQIEKSLEMEMEKIEMEANKPESLTISSHLYLSLLHSMLRIILSEAKMLKAHCWRYMRKPEYDFCFPGGHILDEFERILRSIREKTLKRDMEPEITTKLFHLGETFYDYFDSNVESHFQNPSGMKVKIMSETNRYMKKHRTSTLETILQVPQQQCEEVTEGTSGDHTEPVKTLFGVKILDILNCCAMSNFHTFLSRGSDKEGFRLKTHYELWEINVLEALPTIGLSFSTSEKQLNKICRYVRNNVRWMNLFHPLQDLWLLEDAIEISRNVETASALLRQWKLQKSSSRLMLNNDENPVLRFEYRRNINRFKNRFGLLITAYLECPTMSNIPLKIDKCLNSDLNLDWADSQNFPECSNNCSASLSEFEKKIQQTDVEKSNCSIATYKFNLELKIQYPSFLSETVKEAILKVEQVGEKTTVVTDGDDIRKSATCRADENSE